MKIAIATPCLIEGDAVGNDVRGMYNVLRKLGHEVRLHAEHSSVPEMVASMNAISAEVYIYHHSIYSEPGVRQFVDLKCRKILKYHNITPPHFFGGNSESAIACQKGLNQLPTILNQNCEVWADSEYNGLQLNAIKDTKFKVIPPYNQVDMMRCVVPDYRTVLRYNDWNQNIIMVGRVSPNKDILQGIEGFAAYKNPFARLIIVGENSGDYGKLVSDRIGKMAGRVVITGRVTLEALKAYYLIADALLITSKHEGFCVPMVEAMAMNVPVIANRNCALPYTGGDAVHYTEDNPSEIAAGIAHVLDNKIKYIESGRKRYSNQFSNPSIASLLEGALNCSE